MSFLCLISLKPQRKISEAAETEIKCPVAITEWEAQYASEVFLLIICHWGPPLYFLPPFSLKTQVGWVVVLLAWRLSAWWLSVGVGLQAWLLQASLEAQPSPGTPALHPLVSSFQKLAFSIDQRVAKDRRGQEGQKEFWAESYCGETPLRQSLH